MQGQVVNPGEGEYYPVPQHQCIHDLLKAQAERIPNAIAIAAPGRAPLTYGRLHSHVDYVVKTLNAMGVGRGDRVAIVLPNGPEMAVAFAAVAAGATSAPLNPAYRGGEFDFYLSDLNAKALVIQAQTDTPARAVAQARGIPIIELSPVLEAGAGIFNLTGDECSCAALSGFARPEDVALVLHTSGTTSRPKAVPLTQTNICTSARNIRDALELSEPDRCLNVMPLFHIHGLIGATLSSLLAGASIVCTPGFNAPNFFEWMEAFQPTWYTAVPTMHQAILVRAAANSEIIARRRLRLIRSCSAFLPPQVVAELESVFNAPVIESYGMTEASHQMTSNPLPPRQRKVGSVGVAAGPEVAIMDEAGNLLPLGNIGEIVIRGVNVTLGYENNPTANKSAFTNGWFRTGDQGYLDADRYLFITGRIKEIINRGGEKIAPREVDEALMDHPAVAQAVTFAVPHATLGEDVAAALVLRENASATERELREFAFARLAGHKVPSRVVIVDEMPKGPTGKLQRIGLAQKLASTLKAEYVAPRNSVEDVLASIWSEVLGLEQVGIRDNFFALGGDSLRATQLVARVRATFQVELPLTTVFRGPTIADQALVIEDITLSGKGELEGSPFPSSSLVAMQPGDSQLPFFCIPGNMGNVFTELGDLARHFALEHPFYGLQDGVHNPAQIEALAARYIDEIRTVQPEGPYLLGGVCSGGAVAFEMAQQLRDQGQQVAMLALVEPVPPNVPGIGSYIELTLSVFRRFIRRFARHSRNLAHRDLVGQRAYLRLKLKVIANCLALARYIPRPYPGPIYLFLTDDSLRLSHNPRLAWRELAIGGVEIHEIPGRHDTITGNGDVRIEEAHMKALAEQLSACVDDALTNGNTS